jgi:hypothetical protein
VHNETEFWNEFNAHNPSHYPEVAAAQKFFKSKEDKISKEHYLELVADFVDGSIYDGDIDPQVAEDAREHILPTVTHYMEHKHNKPEYSGHDLWHDVIKGDLHLHWDEIEPLRYER